MNNELIRDVMRLQAVLESRATYNTDCNEDEFEQLRKKYYQQNQLKNIFRTFFLLVEPLISFGIM